MNVLVIVSSNAVWAWTVACLFIGGTLAHYGGQFLAWTDRRRQPAGADPEHAGGYTAEFRAARNRVLSDLGQRPADPDRHRGYAPGGMVLRHPPVPGNTQPEEKHNGR